MHLFELGVDEAARAMAAGEFSPVELVESLLERIDSTEPRVRAWETVDAAGALARARHLERKRRDRLPGEVLFGVPVGLKDIMHAYGLPTTASFDPYRDMPVLENSGAVQALTDAGGIVLGKTTTVQFALGQDAPPTRNPWDLSRTSGGSSSGTAAAVAARQVPAALGTQTTGSLLRPAAYCGIVALKPSFGRISTAGVFPTSWTSDHVGVAVRSVTDAARMLQALARYDGNDPYSCRTPDEDFLAAVRDPRSRPPRLGLVTDLHMRAWPAVRNTIDGAIAHLAAAGASIREISLPADYDLLQAVHWLTLISDAAAIHGEQYSHLAEHYGPRIRGYIEAGHLLPATVYIQSLRLHRRLRAQVTALTREVDALIAPTAPDLPPVVEPGSTLGDPSLQAIWTSFGLPNLTLPVGLAEAGLPVGMQLVGAPLGERTLLSVAHWCESMLEALPAPSFSARGSESSIGSASL
jgi:aspartyl-tRNA(Asn)/glutamyl-tRNA(Gln) amidotransferase subunit A